MPLREKAKALFRSKSKADRDSLSKTSTKNSSLERWPSNVYRPGEPMPRPKYRAVPKKEHTEKLQAFSFAEAWRKRSFQSSHSPMGTRQSSRRNSSRPPSRKNSIFSVGPRGSMSDGCRSNSATSVETGPIGSKKKGQREGGSHAAKPTPLETEPEEEGEGDVGNVGLSRNPSLAAAAAAAKQSAVRVDSKLRKSSRPTPTARDHEPFTEEDVRLALSRSNLAGVKT